MDAKQPCGKIDVTARLFRQPGRLKSRRTEPLFEYEAH